VTTQSVKVKVLDLPVRVFHWVLAALTGFSWWSGTQGGDPMWMTYHLWSGYSILTLLLFRIAWGFVGSTHARFSDFLYGPRTTIEFIKTLPRREAARFAGYNPLGGLSVLLILICVALQIGTGLFANDDIVTEGPLYKWVSKGTSDVLTTIHSYNFYVILALVSLHVAAVLFHLVYKSENLFAPIFTGNKLLSQDAAGAKTRDPGSGLALLVFGIAALAVYLLVRA
jgi:cytochrome b